ncbi:MAG: SDR family NAD(P)-dependent oxidoreductase [Myxococcota bacterium]|nr:SDR family NAD(P)-dependent oxidoreductase [Myxococcota bacterium]
MASGFEGRVALVTGAGDAMGLGFAHARHLAERGARIVLNDHGGGTLGLPEQGVDASAAERAAQRIRDLGGEALANAGDVGDPGTGEAMVEQALAAWGRVDIVVNNAGIASAQFFPQVDAAEMQRHLRVTLLGCLNTAKAAWPHLVERGYGRIVHTGSPACFGNEIASYASTKAGLFGLTRTMAIFGRPHGIRTNLLLPAAISRLTSLLPETDFKAHLRQHFGSERVAPLVAYLVSEGCEASGEAFLAGGGRFSRVVYAASPALEIDESPGSVECAMKQAMAANDWTVMRSAHQSMVHLGVPEDLER